MNVQPRVRFLRRPKPVPGDLRVSWRLSVTLLALLNSRGNKASFAKLHMLNDALRSKESREKLAQMVDGALPYMAWRIRVEPAFSRSLDLMVGEGFVRRTLQKSGQSNFELTIKGECAAKAVSSLEGVLEDEREFLSEVGRSLTEKFVASVIASRGVFQ